MTDTELKRLQAICEVANVDDIEDLSDGFHTFNDLYEQRMYLFAALVKTHKDKAWKSMRHEDGEMCFGGDWFIVGIDTPTGSYTYHYGIKYWDVFDCQILKTAKHWDGHTEKDVTRLLSLPSVQPDHTADISKKVSNSWGHENDLISRKAAIELKPEFLNPNVNRETEEQTAIDRAYARGWNSCNTHWIDEISQLPSAQSERKKGTWIQNDNGTYSCNLCQSWIPEEQYHYAQFCLYCGADMRGEYDGDIISRQAAIDALMDEFKRVPTTAIRAKNRIDRLSPAPSEINK